MPWFASGAGTITYHAWDQTAGSPGGSIALPGRTGGAGAFSATPASATCAIRPVNDAPVVSGPALGTANEDGALSNIDPMLVVTDVDAGSQGLSVTGLPASLPTGITFNASSQKFFLDPTNAAFQSLSLGETQDISIAYGVTDGFVTVPASATFTVPSFFPSTARSTVSREPCPGIS